MRSAGVTEPPELGTAPSVHESGFLLLLGVEILLCDGLIVELMSGRTFAGAVGGGDRRKDSQSPAQRSAAAGASPVGSANGALASSFSKPPGDGSSAVCGRDDVRVRRPPAESSDDGFRLDPLWPRCALSARLGSTAGAPP